jgi:hypothetical protein
MARSRSTKDTSTHTKERITMASTELSADVINALLASSKQRGLYDSELKSIIDSGAKGVQVDLENGTFAGKKAQSVKTGLDNARKKLAEDVRDTVRVIMQDEQVFVINTSA